MRIYITDLEAYNNGHLVGSWYQLPMSLDLLAESIEDVLREGRRACASDHFHEEYFITDFECEYMEIEEYSNISKLNEIAEAMDNINAYDKKSISFLLENNFVKDIFEAIECYEHSVIIYENQTMEDIACSFVEESYNLEDIPTIIANNIDYESIARDMEIEGSFYKIDTDIYEYVG